MKASGHGASQPVRAHANKHKCTITFEKSNLYEQFFNSTPS